MRLTTLAIYTCTLLLPMGATAAGEACSYTESGLTYRGTCGSPLACTNNGGFHLSGLCPGGNDNKCCMSASCTRGMCWNSNTVAGTKKCASVKGKFVTGLCPGLNVYCCQHS